MGWPGPPTSRQVRAAVAWLDLEYERPSIEQQYLISIATETRRSYSAKPARVKMEHLRLRFGRREGPARPVSEQEVALAKARPVSEQEVALAKARWKKWIKRPLGRAAAGPGREG
jgi:hypothetical protein